MARPGAVTRPPVSWRHAPSSVGMALLLAFISGCFSQPESGTAGLPLFANTSDSTNGGASYVGSAACSACHPDVSALARVHAHTQALKLIEGARPHYPAQAKRAGVPAPPDGRSWSDVSYVIGGYTHDALFVDSAGYVLTDGTEGVNTRWVLDFPANGTVAGFAAYRPDQQTPLPFAYEHFRRYTTGARPQGPDNPLSQDGRLGIRGTWTEAGVQCEACHGPGSNHVPDPQAHNIFVDATAGTCARCHTAGADPNVILAADGFINAGSQYAELRASGGHADFTCTICHDPHASVVYDRGAGVRNDCAACHSDQTMARHGGKTFVRGEYAEELRCASCHMPFATKSVTAAAPAVVGTTGRMGDVRSHIFRIDTRNVGFRAMFSRDAAQVATDSLGRAAVTVDFVCLRCHTDETAADNTAFPLSLEFASEIAQRIHVEEVP
jgi:hypothetical protein